MSKSGDPIKILIQVIKIVAGLIIVAILVKAILQSGA